MSGPLIYVDIGTTFEEQDGLSVMTLRSGGQEFQFALTFHALCRLLKASRLAVNATCEATRHHEVLDLSVKKLARSSIKKA